MELNYEGFFLLAKVIANCQQASLSCGGQRQDTYDEAAWIEEWNGEGGGGGGGRITSTRSWTGDLIQIRHSFSSILQLVVVTCDTVSLAIAKLLSFRNHDHFWNVKKLVQLTFVVSDLPLCVSSLTVIGYVVCSVGFDAPKCASAFTITSWVFKNLTEKV